VTDTPIPFFSLAQLVERNTDNVEVPCSNQGGETSFIIKTKTMITLATLEQATAQEVFDQVYRHLIKQNQKCIKEDKCLYRYETEEGNVLKCAAGCLISDEEYTEKFEENSWITLVVEEHVPAAHRELIMKLQEIHDNYLSVNWKSNLDVYAAQENFNIPRLD